MFWRYLPEDFRKAVEDYVADQLPPEALERLRALHQNGDPISSDPMFFHFGGGMAVRNLCREAVEANGLSPEIDWDNYYVEVLEAIAGRVSARSG